MKKAMTLLTLLCTLCISTHATLLFNENFNYTIGDLYNQGGWVKYSSHTEDLIQVVTTPLTYAGYQTAASGYAVNIGSSNTKGQDLMKHIGHLVNANGNVAYIGALLNVNAVGTNYFFALCDSTTQAFADGKSPSEKIKLYAMAGSTESKFKFALGKGNSAYVATEAEYDLNTTYLVVIKYEFVVASGDESSTKTDDPLYLFVNPALTAEPATSTAVATINGDTYGSDIAWRGANAIELKQGQTTSKTCPTVTIDNIRIATTWSDLLTESGSTPIPDPSTTPTIIAIDDAITFSKDAIYTGTEYIATFSILAEDLTGDVTLVSDNNDVTLSKTNVTKAEAESGVEITATLNTNTAGAGTVTITVSSNGAEDVKVTSSWYALALTKCTTIAEMNTAAATASGYDYAYIRFSGEAVVTYTFEQNGNKYYLQDATGAIQVNSAHWSITRGDKITNFEVYASADDLSSGILPVNTLDDIVTTLSRGNEWTPEVVTLVDLQTNPAKYILHLIKVEDVTFADNTAFTSGVTATQGDKTITINLLTGNDLIGVAKPSKADITGISTNASGQVLRVRDKNDVKEITEGGDATAIETIILDQLSGYYEIYNLAGQRLNALQQGVNIIRQGNNTYKVIR